MTSTEQYYGNGRPSGRKSSPEKGHSTEKQQQKVDSLMELSKKIMQKIYESRQGRGTGNISHPDLDELATSVFRKPPSLDEINKAIKREKPEFTQTKFIPVSKETKKKIHDKIQELVENNNETTAEIVRQVNPKDERSARLALKLLEIDEAAGKEAVLEQIRTQAKEVWSYRVGSGYANRGAVESRALLWEIYRTYPDQIVGLTKQEQIQLQSDLSEFLKSSKFPPNIDIPEAINDSLGGFQKEAQETINAINERYSDILDSDGSILVEGDPEELVTEESVAEDLNRLKESWKIYVDEYKKQHNGENPPGDELKAYGQLRGHIKNHQQESLIVVGMTEEENIQQMREQVGDFETPNSISLTRSEIIRLLRNPIKTIERQLLQIEQGLASGGLDGTSVKELVGRYELMMSFYLSDEYDSQRFKIIFENDRNGPDYIKNLQEQGLKVIVIQGDRDEGLLDQIRESKTMFSKEFSSQKRLFQRELENRFTALKVYKVFSNASSFNDQNLISTVEGLPENFFLELNATSGGIGEDAGDLLTLYSCDLMRNWDGNGTKAAFRKEVQLEATERTRSFMKENERYLSEYQKYISGEYFGTETGSSPILMGGDYGDEDEDELISYDSFIDAIVNRAVICKTVTLDWDNIESRGLSQHDDSLFGTKIGRFDDPRLKLMNMKRRARFNLEQWGGEKGREALVIAHYRKKAELYVEHYRHDVDHEANHMVDHFIHNIKHGTWSEEEQVARLESLFFWNPDSHSEHWDERDYKKIIDKITSNKKNIRRELLQEFKIQIGIDIADTHGAQGYSFGESSWRSNKLNEGINYSLGRIFNADGNHQDSLNKFFLSRQVILAFKEYSEKKVGHVHGAEGELLKTYQRVIKYRPHNMVEVMLEMEDPHFLEWFKESGLSSLRETNHTKSEVNASNLVSDLGLVVSRTNRNLFRNVMEITADKRSEAVDYVPVDFSRPMTEWTMAQKQAFEGAVESIIGDKNKTNEVQKAFHSLFSYLNKGLDTADHHDHHIKIPDSATFKRFTSVVYERPLAYTGLRWQDDLPLTLMQHPDRLKFLSQEERNTLMTLGQKFSGSGLYEKHGPFKRMYRENALLEKANDLYTGLVVANQKKLEESMVLISETIADVHGGPAAAFAVQEETFAWEKMRQLSPGKRASSYNATDYRKYSGNQDADIMWPEEAHHFQSELSEITANPSEFIPALMHTKEAELRIATWDKILGGSDGPIAKMIRKAWGDHEGERKYHEFTEFLNEKYPNKILQDKILKYGFYIFLITALFVFYKTFDAARDEMDLTPGTGASGGGGHSGGHGH